MPTIEVHLYNSLVRYGPGNRPFPLEVANGTQPADVARLLGIPPTEIFVAWRNGRNLMVRLHAVLPRINLVQRLIAKFLRPELRLKVWGRALPGLQGSWNPPLRGLERRGYGN